MLNENIPYVHGIPPERIRDAAERARMAFFVSLMRDFTELRTSYLDPSEVLMFESAGNSLTVLWLMYNAAEEDG